jgi:hypothetical protein
LYHFATSKNDPYSGSSYRITKTEWDVLNELFQKIEPAAQNELYASGDHYLLYLTLVKLGFRPPNDVMEIYDMAAQILSLG